MYNVVSFAENRVNDAMLTAMDNFVMPRVEFAIRSVNAYSGRDPKSLYDPDRMDLSLNV